MLTGILEFTSYWVNSLREKPTRIRFSKSKIYHAVICIFQAAGFNVSFEWAVCEIRPLKTRRWELFQASLIFLKCGTLSNSLPRLSSSYLAKWWNRYIILLLLFWNCLSRSCKTCQWTNRHTWRVITAIVKSRDKYVCLRAFTAFFASFATISYSLNLIQLEPGGEWFTS